MHFVSHSPGPPLGNFVDRLWLCADAPSNRQERILPTGTIELVVNLSDDEVRIYDPAQLERCKRFSGAVVSGPYARGFVIDGAQHALIMGVHFKPGGAVPFLGVPAREVANTHLNLAALWGSSAASLRERLCEAAMPRARFRIMEEALQVRFCHLLKGHGAVPIALDAFGQSGSVPSVPDVARRVGLSHRRFIQVFAAEVGLTPKLYCRVLRFQRARSLALQTDAPDWAKLAVACGYYDQSHLIRDFEEFSGVSPTQHPREQSENLLTNHMVLVG